MSLALPQDGPTLTLQHKHQPLHPTLILRQKSVPRPHVSFLMLRDLSKRQEVLKALVQLDDLRGALGQDEVREACRRLFLLLNTVEDAAIKCKTIALLGRLSLLPTADGHQICRSLLTALQSCREDVSGPSASVVCELMSMLAQVSHFNLGQDGALEAISLATDRLSSDCSLVRRAALKLLTSLADVEQSLQPSVGGFTAATDRLLHHFAAGVRDDEPRVRRAALQGLIAIHDKGLKLEPSIYQQAAACLRDDYEEVRVEALQLVWLFCVAFPERLVRIGKDKDVELRLLDDGFVKICDMMNDLTLKVRERAATLLGSLHNVSFKFLQQTLDKKLMSHLRRKKSEHEKARDRHRAGMTISEWESGRQWNDGNIPQADLDPEEVQLMNSGACGAFVHGLEDEFLEVRSASVRSMCSLAVHRPRFATLCVDYLVDMLNDEIEAVRLIALESLQQIMQSLELRDDQLETVLCGLLDASAVSRNAVRELLAVCPLSACSMLRTCVDSLLTNLSRYPADKMAIWRCMCALGKRHSSLIVALAPALLDVSPVFAATERNVEDPAYVAILILIFNALPHCPTLLSVFPPFLASHYSFLVNSYPELLPAIEFGVGGGFKAVLSRTPSNVSAQLQEGRDFIRRAMERSVSLTGDNLTAKAELIQLTVFDLKRLSQMQTPASTLAECSSIYLECATRLLKAIDPSRPDHHVSEWNSALAAQVLSRSYRLQYTFSGLSVEEQLHVAELRLVVHLLQMLHKPSCTKEDISLLQQRVAKLERHCQTHSLAPSPCLKQLVEHEKEMHTSRASAVMRSVMEALQCWTPICLLPTGPVTCAKAAFEQPNPLGSENAIQFASSLATAVHTEAVLNHVEQHKIVVQVIFPDLTHQLFYTKASDVQELEPGKGHLSKDLILTHGLWSESSHIQITVMQAIPLDIDEQLVLGTATETTPATPSLKSPLTPLTPISPSVRGFRPNVADQNSEDVRLTNEIAAVLKSSLVPLCQPVRLCLLPKGRIYYRT